MGMFSDFHRNNFWTNLFKINVTSFLFLKILVVDIQNVETVTSQINSILYLRSSVLSSYRRPNNAKYATCISQLYHAIKQPF